MNGYKNRICDQLLTRKLAGDEWQDVPKFWDAVRFSVDHEEGFGHYILTGSAVPPDMSEVVHTGTGRIVSLSGRTSRVQTVFRVSRIG